MELVDDEARIGAAIDGFFAGLRVVDPQAGFGCSAPFDSAIWSIFSLLEGNSEQAATVESLTKRISIILECEDLSAESRRLLEDFRVSGNLWGGGPSERSEVLPRTLGVALCESVRERRVERAAEIVAITHFSPLVVQASIALVEFQASLLLGHSVDMAVGYSLEVVDHPEIRQALQIEASVGRESLSAADSVVEVVRWVVWASRQDTQTMLLLESIAESSGNNPVVASLCGAVLGSQGREFPTAPCVDLRSAEIAAQIAYVRQSLSSR